MKYILFILLSVFQTTLLAQQNQINKKEIVGDTSFITKQDTLFYEVTVTYFSNGETQTNTNPLGDSISAIKNFSNRLFFISRQISDLVLKNILTRSEGFTLIFEDEFKLSNYGFPSSFNVSLDSFENQYIGDWAVVNSKGENLSFKIEKENNKLWLTGKDGKKYPLFIFSDKQFRILNFVEDKKAVDFFFISNKRYMDINMEYMFFWNRS